MIFNPVGIFSTASASTFKQLRTKVGSDNMHPELSHAPGENPIATRDLQHSFARLQIKQAFTRRSNQDALKIIAIAHPIVPKSSFLVPDASCLFMQIVCLGSVFVC